LSLTVVPQPGVIDPAEALLAVLGMRPIVTHVIEKITPEQWKRARDLQFEVNKSAHAFVMGTLLEPTPSHDRPGYMRTLRDLSTKYDPGQIEAMLTALPEDFGESSGPFLMMAQRAFSLMNSQLPRQAARSLAGSTHLPVPVRLLDRFNSLFDVLDEPTEILNLAAAGQLLRSQVTSADGIYPTLVAYMRQVLAAEIIGQRGQSPHWQLPYHAELGAEKLLGADLTSPALRKVLQTPAPEAQNPPPEGGNQGAKVPVQMMTRTQRTDANAP
jgi:hypothetical protein